jgi:hypothetical protein
VNADVDGTAARVVHALHPTLVAELRLIHRAQRERLRSLVDGVCAEPVPGGTGRELSLRECCRERDRILLLLRNELARLAP